MSQHNGEYGGRVLRAIPNAGGKSYIKGAILTPEEVSGWPLANRKALQTSGKVEWFGPPAPQEEAARAAGKPAGRGKVQTPKKEAASDKSGQSKKESAPAPAPRRRR